MANLFTYFDGALPRLFTEMKVCWKTFLQLTWSLIFYEKYSTSLSTIVLVVLTTANFGGFSNFCRYYTRSQAGKSTGYRTNFVILCTCKCQECVFIIEHVEYVIFKEIYIFARILLGQSWPYSCTTKIIHMMNIYYVIIHKIHRTILKELNWQGR
jgi:hypothetical protein